MTAGSMVGHLARRSLRPVRPAHPPPADRRARSWSAATSTRSPTSGACPPTTCGCGSASTRSTHHAVLGVPHVRAPPRRPARPLRRRLPSRPRRPRGALRRARHQRPERHGRAAVDVRRPRGHPRRHPVAGPAGAAPPARGARGRRSSATSTTSWNASASGLISAATGCSPRPSAAGGSAADESDRFVERLLGLELTQDHVRPGRGLRRRRASSGPARTASAPLAQRARPAHPRRGRRPRPLAGPHRPPRPRLTRSGPDLRARAPRSAPRGAGLTAGGRSAGVGSGRASGLRVGARRRSARPGLASGRRPAACGARRSVGPGGRKSSTTPGSGMVRTSSTTVGSGGGLTSVRSRSSRGGRERRRLVRDGRPAAASRRPIQ